MFNIALTCTTIRNFQNALNSKNTEEKKKKEKDLEKDLTKQKE